MKKLKLLTVVAVAVVIGAGMFSSCEKDPNLTDSMLNSQKLFPSKMKTFATMEELSLEVEKIQAMDYIERIAYEKANGYSSFGSQCDMIYYPSVDEETCPFKTEEDMRKFVSEHSEYVQLIKDYDGEILYVPHLFNNPCRYLINNDKILQVGDEYIKVFESGIVTTETKNLQALKNLKEEELSSIKEDGLFNYSRRESSLDKKHKWLVQNSYYFNEAKNSGETERIRIECITYWTRHTSTRISFWTEVDIQAFRKILGGWAGVKRTITRDLTFKSTSNTFRSGAQPIPATEYSSGSGKYNGINFRIFEQYDLTILGTAETKKVYTFTEITGYVSIPAVRLNQ